MSVIQKAKKEKTFCWLQITEKTVFIKITVVTFEKLVTIQSSHQIKLEQTKYSLQCKANSYSLLRTLYSVNTIPYSVLIAHRLLQMRDVIWQGVGASPAGVLGRSCRCRSIRSRRIWWRIWVFPSCKNAIINVDAFKVKTMSVIQKAKKEKTPLLTFKWLSRFSYITEFIKLNEWKFSIATKITFKFRTLQFPKKQWPSTVVLSGIKQVHF
jgi:hypothetical protein